MEQTGNTTVSPTRFLTHSQSNVDAHGGSAYMYFLLVLCFYGVFLTGIMMGYFRSKRKEKRRINIFTRLVHEQEQREWGALPKKHITLPGMVSVPFCGYHGNQVGHTHHGGFLSSPLACTLCTEQSSSSSLCSSSDTRMTIEEESDPAEEKGMGGSERSGEDSP